MDRLAKQQANLKATKKWQTANRSRYLSIVEQWNKKNPEKYKSNWRKSMLRKKYGITNEDYENILKAQGGVCAVCQKPPRRRWLSVDHDHKTGLIRGLLCDKCNLALGGLNEDLILIQRLVSYLMGKSPKSEVLNG